MGPCEAKGRELKKLEGEELADLLAELEEAVRSCVNGEITDVTIGLIVELTIAAIRDKRPLFPNPLDEPNFYRMYIKRWVKEELDQGEAIANKQASDLAQLKNLM
jgi:hypothetical protein